MLDPSQCPALLYVLWNPHQERFSPLPSRQGGHAHTLHLPTHVDRKHDVLPQATCSLGQQRNNSDIY